MQGQRNGSLVVGSVFLLLASGSIALVSPAPRANAQPLCSYPQVKRIEVDVRSPVEGETAGSPVLFHLRAKRPKRCGPTFHVTVNGVPYQFLGGSAGTSPLTADNPEKSRSLPRRNRFRGCISAREFFGSLKLPPGSHLLRVDGCPQGTAVPQTVPAEVSFSVQPATGRDDASLPITGVPVRALVLVALLLVVIPLLILFLLPPPRLRARARGLLDD